jgi:predicted neutral ceramidase superfamily lipid hydrolase
MEADAPGAADEPADAEPALRRLGAIIVASTALLTAVFYGALAFLAPEPIPGLYARVPWYLVVAAALFVGTIVLLERYDAGGRTVLLTAAVTGVTGLVVATLAAEGVRYAVVTPSLVLSRLLIYLVAAGLAATGIGYWALNHWREFTTRAQ